MTTRSNGLPRPGRPPTAYRITAHARAGDIGAAETGTTSIDLDTTWGGRRQVYPDRPRSSRPRSRLAC